MSTLLLRLAGPMQAWGDHSSRWERRATRKEPTKSGIVGLLAAAQGRRRTDPIEDLAKLAFGVRVDQPGQLERDFGTAVRLSDGKVMPLSERFYLADACFVAGVSGDATLLEALDEQLRNPRFPLFLGRRSYVPSVQISLGVVPGDLEASLRAVEWQASAWFRRKALRRPRLDLVLDADAVDPTRQDVVMDVIRDVPLSYDPRRREYGWRDVARVSPVEVDNPLGTEGDDFFAAVVSG